VILATQPLQANANLSPFLTRMGTAPNLSPRNTLKANNCGKARGLITPEAKKTPKYPNKP